MNAISRPDPESRRSFIRCQPPRRNSPRFSRFLLRPEHKNKKFTLCVTLLQDIDIKPLARAFSRFFHFPLICGILPLPSSVHLRRSQPRDIPQPSARCRPSPAKTRLASAASFSGRSTKTKSLLSASPSFKILTPHHLQGNSLDSSTSRSFAASSRCPPRSTFAVLSRERSPGRQRAARHPAKTTRLQPSSFPARNAKTKSLLSASPTANTMKHNHLYPHFLQSSARAHSLDGLLHCPPRSAYAIFSRGKTQARFTPAPLRVARQNLVIR